MTTIHRFGLPTHHTDPAWVEYTALGRAQDRDYFGPGWDASPEAILDRARRSLDRHEVHRFLARRDGDAVGCAMVRRNLLDDPDAVDVSVYVLPGHRRSGVGSALAAAVRELVGDLPVTRATAWLLAPIPTGEVLRPPNGVGAVPADDPGVRLALDNGFELLQVERVSRFDFAAPLQDPAEALAAASAVAGDDFEVISWEGAAPADMRADLAVLQQRMSIDPPSGDLTVVESRWDAERVRYEDERLLPTMRRWRTVVRHRPTGQVVGLTELNRELTNPEGFVAQEDTIVLPKFRGHRLGMLIKAANLEFVRAVLPGAGSVITWNAEENRHMLAVNEALGFRPILVEGAFERPLS